MCSNNRDNPFCQYTYTMGCWNMLEDNNCCGGSHLQCAWRIYSTENVIRFILSVEQGNVFLDVCSLQQNFCNLVFPPALNSSKMITFIAGECISSTEKRHSSTLILLFEASRQNVMLQHYWKNFTASHDISTFCVVQLCFRKSLISGVC